MKIPKELTHVTSLSKALALILIISLPIVAFFLGMKYQKYIIPTCKSEIQSQIIVPEASPTKIPTPTPIFPDWEIYISPDNSFSFQYPKSWKLNVQSNWVEVGCSVYGGEVEPGVSCDPGYNLGSFGFYRLTTRSLDEILSNETLKDKVKISFQGHEAVRAVYPGGPQAGESYLEIYINDRGAIFEINLTYRNIFNAKTFSELPKPKPDILSTFKFLDN